MRIEERELEAGGRTEEGKEAQRPSPARQLVALQAGHHLVGTYRTVRNPVRRSLQRLDVSLHALETRPPPVASAYAPAPRTFARNQGYRLDELVEIIEEVG